MGTEQNKIEPRRLKGFKDYMPEVMELRSRFQHIIRNEARLAGFREIGTPALEYAETLLGQGSDETDKQVYRFDDHGGRRVAMRFDLTVPFARFVAEHQGQLVFPFKRLQIGEVWRGENTQKGRYREFCQCDLDIIGVDSVNADIEVISCLYRTLGRFDLGGFTMRLGNRALLSAMLSKSFPGLGTDGESKALIALDKLDKIGEDQVCALLSEIPGASLAAARLFLTLLTTKDQSGSTDSKRIREFLGQDEKGLAELNRMETALSALRDVAQAVPGSSVKLDLSIARGLAYYTGIVFETTLDRLPGFGSISSGGRYNNLAERFTSRALPGVGGSIGLDRLLAGLEELGKVETKTSDLIFIAVATDDALAAALLLANELRAHNIPCDIGLTTGKVGHQFKHADRLGCPVVLTIGSAEVESKTCNVKIMATGSETKGLPRGEVVNFVKSILSNELSNGGK
jgi:histidyl-tRNA synthetase